jgi:hypothetical protein
MSEKSFVEIANLIRDDSFRGVLSAEARISLMCEGQDLSGLSGEISSNAEMSDIRMIEGNSGKYYYSNKHVTDSYARLSVMIEERDLLKLIVSTVRNDSRIYPRTTAAETFTESPYSIGIDELDELIKIVETSDDYNDIEFCRTSIDTLYLYSKDFIPRAQADYLSEWDAVGQYESQ